MVTSLCLVVTSLCLVVTSLCLVVTSLCLVVTSLCLVVTSVMSCGFMTFINGNQHKFRLFRFLNWFLEKYIVAKSI